jgi:hypothetical protein
MRLYPSWEQLNQMNNPLTNGERALIKYLDENLPADPSWNSTQPLGDYKGWLIFAQPFLNGSRPDVVIYHPFVGIVIYEVKDWKLDSYAWGKDADNRTTLFVDDGRGRHVVKSPVKQVEYYKEKIIGQLVPTIGEEIDTNQKNYGLVKTALYFHNTSTENARELFATAVKSFKSFPVFGNDSLKKSRLFEIVPDVQYSTSRYWNRGWNHELLFWLYPPYHSIEQGQKLTLKGNQIKIAEPRPGHHRVRGVAGSGKTQALAYRAGKLASMNMNVLVVSFNITLWHYIKDMIARSPFNFNWDKITFTHFHGFCKDRLNDFEAPFPISPNRKDYANQDEYEKAREHFFKVDVPKAVHDALLINQGNRLERQQYLKYDAILIDEGQDYHIEWYELLTTNFMDSRDELLLVSDKRQNIYDRILDWQDKRNAATRYLLTKFNEDFVRLNETFRLPKRVAEMSNEFSDVFGLDQEMKVSKIQEMPALIFSQHIVWLNIKHESWLEYIHSAFRRLKNETYSPSDMVILLPSHKFGNECVKFFNELNIEVNHVFEDDSEGKFHQHKKAFWMGDSRLKMSTIHSFKGWELANIVLFVPERAPETNSKLDAIVYTAITRTRENLIVINANRRYNDFGEKFPKLWNAQN